MESVFSRQKVWIHQPHLFILFLVHVQAGLPEVYTRQRNWLRLQGLDWMLQDFSDFFPCSANDVTRDLVKLFGGM